MPFMNFEASYYANNTDFGTINVYSLENKKWVSKPFGKIPNKYLDAEYPIDLSFPDIVLINDNHVAISYPLSQIIKVFDYQSQNKVAEYCMSNPTYSTKNPFRKLIFTRTRQLSKYSSLLFRTTLRHKKTNQLFRIYFEKQPLKDLNGRLNQLRSRKLILSTIDLDAKVIRYSRINSKNPTRYMSKFCVNSNSGTIYTSENLKETDDFLNLSKFLLDE